MAPPLKKRRMNSAEEKSNKLPELVVNTETALLPILGRVMDFCEPRTITALALTCRSAHEQYQRFERQAVVRMADWSDVLKPGWRGNSIHVSVHVEIKPGYVIEYEQPTWCDVMRKGHYQVVRITKTHIHLIRLTRIPTPVSRDRCAFRRKYYTLQLELASLGNWHRRNYNDFAQKELFKTVNPYLKNTEFLRRIADDPTVPKPAPYGFRLDQGARSPAITGNWKCVAKSYEDYLLVWKQYWVEHGPLRTHMKHWDSKKFTNAQRKIMCWYVDEDHPAKDKSLVTHEFQMGDMQVPKCNYHQ